MGIIPKPGKIQWLPSQNEENFMDSIPKLEKILGVSPPNWENFTDINQNSKNLRNFYG